MPDDLAESTPLLDAAAVGATLLSAATFAFLTYFALRSGPRPTGVPEVALLFGALALASLGRRLAARAVGRRARRSTSQHRAHL